jgi:hypothetical protein
MQVMRAINGCRITQKAAVHKVHVESCGYLVAGPSHGISGTCLKVVNERDHVDHGLGREPGNGSGPDVIDSDAGQQRCEPLTLCEVAGRPERVVFDDLNRSVTGAFGHQIARSYATTVLWSHLPIVSRPIMDRQGV